MIRIIDHEPINKQMGLKEANGPKGDQRERSSKPMGSMWCRKVRIGHNRPEVLRVKKVRGLWQAHEPQRWRIR